MNLVQLDISAIKQSDSQNNAYVLLLNETVGKRQLPIVIGWCEARSIAIALEENNEADRPLTHDLFKTMGDKFNIIVQKVVIHTLIEGIFHASFYCEFNNNAFHGLADLFVISIILLLLHCDMVFTTFALTNLPSNKYRSHLFYSIYIT